MDLIVRSCAQGGNSGFLFIVYPQFSISRTSDGAASSCCVSHCRSSSTFATTSAKPRQEETDNSIVFQPQKFTYSRATPSIRWPHLNYEDASLPPPLTPSPSVEVQPVDLDEDASSASVSYRDEAHEGLVSEISRTKMKKMNKLALKRARDWKERCSYLKGEILKLKEDQCVADVLEDRQMHLSSADYCHLVKWLGQESWQRALDVFEWLNSMEWYTPDPQMLSTILAVMGKNGQEAVAVDIFENEMTTSQLTVQVYNAMMGVYARSGRYEKVCQMFDVMRERNCEPDLVSFNTLINARLKSKDGMAPGLGTELLEEMRRWGVRPDVITYNTLISACSRTSILEEAIIVFDDMKRNQCTPDLWTYNAMISVYGRCGMPRKAENMLEEIETCGFFPDAVTYNSLVFAFGREGNVGKVKEICDEMVKKGFSRDEMTYNTLIHMHGKHGRCDVALELYKSMKFSGNLPDSVTYTILIDLLGKACRLSEAACLFSEMMDAGIKPTVRTYCALICGYAKVGRWEKAEETFNAMLNHGIKPDSLVYTVMIEGYLRFNEQDKAMDLYDVMIQDRVKPEIVVLEVMLKQINVEEKADVIGRLIHDMKETCGMDAQTICSMLVKAECYDAAASILKKTKFDESEINHETILSILGSYSSSGRHSEGLALLQRIKQNAPGSKKLITEAMVVMLCKDQQFHAAINEYHATREVFLFSSFGLTMYETLIESCVNRGLHSEASQVYSDMVFSNIEPSESIYRSMAHGYCKMGFPETAHHIILLAEDKGIMVCDSMIYTDLIEAYGKVKLWQNAENLVQNLAEKFLSDRKIWNSLIMAYAESGCYERARAVFNKLMKSGPSPSVDSVNGLLQALIVDGRLPELYVVVEELQDMGFTISKSSITLMLDAFANAGNLFETKKIYCGMKAAGYAPSMHQYRLMVGLFCREKQVGDAEAMVLEMTEAGLIPDVSIWNSMMKLYSRIGDFAKLVQIYQGMQSGGVKPNEETYNVLIVMYCQNRRPEEGLVLMREMRREGMEAKVDTCRSLISALGKQKLVKQAEELFALLLLERRKLDRSFYHAMMKVYRDCDLHSEAENVVKMMKDAGVEPNAATMHLLMASYGGSGLPEEADKVLKSLKETSFPLTTLPYSSVLDAYLKSGEYGAAIRKLAEMKSDDVEPDHRICTCFVRAASLCRRRTETVELLTAIKDAGFGIPLRILSEKPESFLAEVDGFLDMLIPLPDDAALNFVNALEDLLWAFELRATASWIFQLAVRRNIYRRNLFRVAEKDWSADFRRLSAGAALVGLTLWLDRMQDASLHGVPDSPKSVALVTGMAEYNAVSLNGTLKACLWEMGSPFLPCRARTGIFVAKSHSLKMWLKNSSFCFDLELRDAPSLPEANSMQLVDGCFMRREMVAAFRQIHEKLGSVRPKQYAKLALLPEGKRERVIQAHIDGGKEREEKMKAKMDLMRKKKMKNIRRRRYIQQASLLKQQQRLLMYQNIQHHQ